jgi:hypothetical protein
VISLQKVDSLGIFEYGRKLKRFLRYKAGGIWIKIHLNPEIQSRQSIRAFSYFLFIKHSLHQYSHSLTFVWPSTNTGNSSSLFLPQLLQIPLFAVDISMRLNYRDSTEKPSEYMYNIVCSGLVGIGFLHVIGFHCHLVAPWYMKDCIVGLNAITTKQIF